MADSTSIPRRSLVTAAVAILVGIGLLVGILLSRLADSHRWLLHTREVQLALRDAQALLAEAETAQRGFLLTQDTRLLEPYRAAGTSLAEVVATVAELTRDNPAQQSRVPALREATEGRIDALAQVLALAVAGERDRAIEQLRGGSGTALMERARSLLNEMDAEEARLLGERLAMVGRQDRVARAMLVALTAAGAALLVGLHVTMSRGARRLRDSEELTRSLIDNAPAYVRVRTLTGEPMLENRRYREVRATRPAQAGWLDQQLADHEARAARGGVVMEASVSQALPDGDVRHFQGASVPVRADDGRTIGVASYLTDVSALERARADLQRLTQTLEQRVRQRTARLTEANAELETFSFMVSHDLRAPLRAVQGFAQALQEDAAPRLHQDDRDVIARIRAAAARMDRLIEDLLAYGRMSRIELATGPVPLSATIDEALESLAAELAGAHADVSVDPSLPTVLGHAPVLRQVFQNLVSNAAKFVPPGTRPRVRIVSEPARAGWARVAVHDNGIGVAPADHARIFDPFERLHGSERYGGSGIGLAIVRKGIERLGGRVGLVSVPGAGSTFWIELPAYRPGLAPVAHASAVDAPPAQDVDARLTAGGHG